MTKKESGYKVIVSESVVDYIGQRTDYTNIGKKYGFTARWNLKDVPFLVQDSLSEEQGHTWWQHILESPGQAQYRS